MKKRLKLYYLLTLLLPFIFIPLHAQHPDEALAYLGHQWIKDAKINNITGVRFQIRNWKKNNRFRKSIKEYKNYYRYDKEGRMILSASDGTSDIIYFTYPLLDKSMWGRYVSFNSSCYVPYGQVATFDLNDYADLPWGIILPNTYNLNIGVEINGDDHVYHIYADGSFMMDKKYTRLSIDYDYNDIQRCGNKLRSVLKEEYHKGSKTYMDYKMREVKYVYHYNGKKDRLSRIDQYKKSYTYNGDSTFYKTSIFIEYRHKLPRRIIYYMDSEGMGLHAYMYRYHYFRRLKKVNL